MPRKNPVPESERAICRRLLEIRESLALTRATFARLIGIDSTRLAEYEHERVPVPYAIGNAICQHANVNQRWLATGKLPKFPFFQTTVESEPRKLFSYVYAHKLKAGFEQHWSEFDQAFPNAPVLRGFDAEREIAMLTGEIAFLMAHMDAVQRSTFADMVRVVTSAAMKDFAKRKRRC